MGSDLSLTGYYGIFDFGIRSSIIKYVAEFEATGDRDRLTRVINLSLFVYSCIALVLMAVAAVGSMYVDLIFRISPIFHVVAQRLFLTVGLTVALAFPLSVFGGVLEGLQKFHFVNLTQAASTLLRAVLIVLALHRGLGLLTIAIITVVIPFLTYATYAWKVMRTIPLQFGMRFIDRATFRQIFNYSFFSFISIVAFRLRFQSDAVIIGAMLSASAITYFAVGSKLISYCFLLVGGVTQILTPMSSQFDATRDRERLRKLFILGNRACALIVFPISAVLFVLGKSVIDVWVGSRYESSYVILIILLIPSVLSDIQGGSRQILYGIGRHKALAVVNLTEGVLNVIASIVLIHYWGIVGDALGTAIPLTLASVCFLPIYLCRLLKVPMKEFLNGAYMLPLVVCVPLVVTLLFMQHLFRPHNYFQLAAQVAAGSLVYGLSSLWLVFRKEPMVLELRNKFAYYVSLAFGR